MKLLPPIALGALCFSLTACSSNRPALKTSLAQRGSTQHPLFVGTSVDGDTVVAATHYDAVNGLAVTADEIGLATNDGMTCIREMPTGTHVPMWICRFDKDRAARREQLRNALDKPLTKTQMQSGPSCTNRAF
jgi:hypothetical protein